MIYLASGPFREYIRKQSLLNLKKMGLKLGSRLGLHSKELVDCTSDDASTVKIHVRDPFTEFSLQIQISTMIYDRDWLFKQLGRSTDYVVTAFSILLLTKMANHIQDFRLIVDWSSVPANGFGQKAILKLAFQDDSIWAFHDQELDERQKNLQRVLGIVSSQSGRSHRHSVLFGADKKKFQHRFKQYGVDLIDNYTECYKVVRLMIKSGKWLEATQKHRQLDVRMKYIEERMLDEYWRLKVAVGQPN